MCEWMMILVEYYDAILISVIYCCSPPISFTQSIRMNSDRTMISMICDLWYITDNKFAIYGSMSNNPSRYIMIYATPIIILIIINRIASTANNIIYISHAIPINIYNTYQSTVVCQLLFVCSTVIVSHLILLIENRWGDVILLALCCGMSHTIWCDRHDPHQWADVISVPFIAKGYQLIYLFFLFDL